MRKILLIVAMFGLVFMGFGAAITNVKLVPTKSSYTVGESVQIQWTASGIPSGEKVKITLWRQGVSTRICLIAADVPVNAGSYSWTIPSSCTNPDTSATENLVGGTFHIRVRWQGNPVFGESPNFTITEPQNITVALSPDSSSYNVGNNLSVNWSYTGITPTASDKVKITLRRASAPDTSICPLADNINLSTGHWTWNNIPTTCGSVNLTSAGNLFIRVRWKGHPVWGNSHNFTITEEGGEEGESLDDVWLEKLKEILKGMKEIQVIRWPGPRPDPCPICHIEILDLTREKIRQSLEKAGLREPVFVEIHDARGKLINIGKFAPAGKPGLKTGAKGTIPVRTKMTMPVIAPRITRFDLPNKAVASRVKSGSGYFLVIRRASDGKIISRNPVNLKVEEKPVIK